MLMRNVWFLSIVIMGFIHSSPMAMAASPDDQPGTASVAREYEHILAFDAHAKFNADGSMEMREEIEVQALGESIRRGIFRTLPLTWNRQDGKIFSVDYQIKNVLRDGLPEPFSLDKSRKILTVRIGSADRELNSGIYKYEILYQVRNHFSRFPEWDELYWNVTGNEWQYPIDKVSFTLQLPDADRHLNLDGRDTRLRSIDVYTGGAGEKERNAEILANGDVRVSQPLSEGEGLTVVYTWPRSILAAAPEPEAASPLRHLLVPTLKTSVLWIPVLLLAVYCLLWLGRNRLKMPSIVPLFTLPAAMSPGYLRYITTRIYDDVAFSSDLLDLVAKRGMAITTNVSDKKAVPFSKSNKDGEQWLTCRTATDNPRLNVRDKKLLDILFSRERRQINLSHAHQWPMQMALKWLKHSCEEQEGRVFSPWGKPIRRAIYLLLLIPVMSGAMFSVGSAFSTIPALLFLLLGISILFDARTFWKTWRVTGVIVALLVLPFAIILSDVALFESRPLTQHPAGFLGALLTATVICVVFRCLIPRYTQQGLNDLATAKGLKLYLGTAEKNRFQHLYPPEQTVDHFERLLPVALALGVGKTWANSFAQYLVSSGSFSEVFSNADWWQVQHFHDSCRSSSQATPSVRSGSSSSSSSGSGSSGGGSSGGGSGGGGGGGW